jgi:hypothetical protein
MDEEGALQFILETLQGAKGGDEAASAVRQTLMEGNVLDDLLCCFILNALGKSNAACVANMEMILKFCGEKKTSG